LSGLTSLPINGRTMEPKLDRRRALFVLNKIDRGYCLEMICADFLAGANLDNGNPDALLLSLGRLFGLLPPPQKRQFLEEVRQAS
jgi:hypothetical protein